MWYSAKQGTTHRSTSHLVHLFTVPFLWPQDEHRQQWSWVYDFAGQCWLWQLLSHTTFVASALGLPTNGGGGQSWLFSPSSNKFLTRSPTSQWVYLAPYEANSIQLLNPVRSRKWKNNFVVHLKVHRLIEQVLSHTIRTVDVTEVPVVPFHDMRFHRAVAVITKISFCWW